MVTNNSFLAARARNKARRLLDMSRANRGRDRLELARQALELAQLAMRLEDNEERRQERMRELRETGPVDQHEVRHGRTMTMWPRVNSRAR